MANTQTFAEAMNAVGVALSTLAQEFSRVMSSWQASPGFQELLALSFAYEHHQAYMALPPATQRRIHNLLVHEKWLKKLR